MSTMLSNFSKIKRMTNVAKDKDIRPISLDKVWEFVQSTVETPMKEKTWYEFGIKLYSTKEGKIMMQGVSLKEIHHGN